MTTRSAAFLAFLLGTTICGSVASAQSPLTSPPPARIPVDAHGVDVVTGAFTTALPLLTVGPPNGGGLSVSRQYYLPGWRESYIGTVNTVDSVNYFVSVGGSSEVFVKSGSTFTNAQGGTSTLAYNATTLQYTYTLGDGTVLIFAPAAAGYQAGPWAANGGLLDQITHPDGQVDVYNYSLLQFCTGGQQVANATGQSVKTTPAAQPNTCTNVTRLNTITSNTDYQVMLVYADHGVNPSQPHFTVVGLSGSNLATSANNVVSTSIADTPTTSTINDGLVNHLYTYNANGYIQTIQVGTSPATTTTNVTYDTSFRVATYNDNYYTYNYGYVDSGGLRTTTVTGPSGNKVYVSNLSTGLVQSFKDELSRTTSYAYDASGRLQQITKPEGDYTTYAYDARGNLTTTTLVAKPSSGVANIVNQASFDTSCTVLVKCNKPNYTIDGRGFETDYSYDPTHGGVTSVTLPAPSTGAVRPQTRYTFTAFTAPSGSGSIYRLSSQSSCMATASCAGTSDEQKSSVTYGTNLLPSSSTAGSGDGFLAATSAFTWDDAGNLLTVDGPLAGTADTTRYRYGSAHQLVGVVGPDPDGAGPLAYRATRYTYDARGLTTLVEKGTVASQSDPDWANFSSLIQQATTYDSAGLKTTDALTQGGVTQTLTQYSYNTRTLPQCVAVRDPAYQSSLPAGACTVTTSTAPGADQISQRGYDAAGEVTQTIEGVGTSDQATTAVMTYGGDGEQLTALDANNNLTTFVYDGVNRLVQIQFPTVGSPQPPATGAGTSQTTTAGIEAYTYNADSSITSLTRRGGATLTYGLDNLNRMTSLTQSAGNANYNYAYDNLSRLTGTTSSQGYSHSFTYDALNRKTSEVTPLGTVQSAYDAAGDRTRLTWPDGFYVTYVYDGVGEMTAVEENGATSGPSLLTTLAYDNLGRRTTLTRGNGVATTYGYDTASRLSAIAHALPTTSQNQTETYAYNVASQLVTKTSSNDSWAWNAAANFNRNYTANGLNEQISAGATSLAWGGKGTLTGDGTFTYTYDTLNKLFGVSNGSTQTYDGGGRLYSVGASAVTRLVYDGDLSIAEYGASGAVLRRFVPGAAEDEPLVWYEGSGVTTRYGLTADRLGSITATTTDAGSANAINSYDEYGLPGAANMGRYQYTGQKFLSEFGMYDYKARNYVPGLGRFVQPDPLGYATGPNLYQYVNSNPVNYTDPKGTSCSGVGGSGSAYSGTGANGLSEFTGYVSCQNGGGSIYQTSYQGYAVLSSFGYGGSEAGGGGGSSPGGLPLPQKMQIDHTVPPNSKICTTSTGLQFYAPPSFNLDAINVAGHAGGLNPFAANSAVGHSGTYDYQRVNAGVMGTGFYSAYTNASNFAVGAYLQGTGVSQQQAGDIANAFAGLGMMSSNAGSTAQNQFRDAGYQAAAGGGVSCTTGN